MLVKLMLNTVAVNFYLYRKYEKYKLDQWRDILRGHWPHRKVRTLL